MTHATSALRLYDEDVREPFDRFAHRMWPSQNDARSTESDRSPSSPCIVFVKDGEVLGHLGTLPVRLSVAGRAWDAHWVVGLMVVPEYRNRPIAPLLVRKMSETVEVGLTLHVEPAAAKVFAGLQWRHVGLMPQYARLLSAAAIARVVSAKTRAFLPTRCACVWPAAAHGILAAAAGVNVAGRGLAALRRMAQWTRRPLTVAEERDFDSGYVDLGRRVQGKFAVWVRRDEQFLMTRYRARLGQYRLLACREGGTLVGYCIVKLKQFTQDPRMGDLRMGTIVDCVFDPDDSRVVGRLVRAAVALCRRESMDVVFCSASHRQLRRELRWNGFAGMRGTLRVAYHDRAGVIDTDIPFGSWHLMRGDSDADANC
jgi:GNAT superfamily N-acetyltransferase